MLDQIIQGQAKSYKERDTKSYKIELESSSRIRPSQGHPIPSQIRLAQAIPGQVRSHDVRSGHVPCRCGGSASLVGWVHVPLLPVLASLRLEADENGGRERLEGDGEGGLERGELRRDSEWVRGSTRPERRRGLYLGASLNGTAERSGRDGHKNAARDVHENSTLSKLYNCYSVSQYSSRSDF